ncbi:MAG TPA: hypothetical protein VFP49_09925 [Nitrososphaeraceae archaeon]|nr:hypothetical protein [Nitrososphaeraceae archaeon]
MEKNFVLDVNMAHITMHIGEMKLENSKRNTVEEMIQGKGK